MSARDREMIAAVAAIEDSDDGPAFTIPPARPIYSVLSAGTVDPAAVVRDIAWQLKASRCDR